MIVNKVYFRLLDYQSADTDNVRLVLNIPPLANFIDQKCERCVKCFWFCYINYRTRRKTTLASMHIRHTKFHKMSTFSSLLCSVLAKFISALDELWTPTNSHFDLDFVSHFILTLYWWNRPLNFCCHEQYLTSL